MSARVFLIHGNRASAESLRVAAFPAATRMTGDVVFSRVKPELIFVFQPWALHNFPLCGVITPF